ncbi:Uncharacterised protein [uncultured archaeon]|nr:Uncharacterised protein [uncultured archaeon]
MIHSCNIEDVKYNSRTASIIRLSLGPGMDCPSGCIYFSQSYLVLENNTIYQIFDAPGDASAFSDFIWDRIKVPISDISKISTKEIVDYNGALAYKFTPMKYIKGELYNVLDGKKGNLESRISGNISPGNITIDNAKELAINELKKKGYTPASLKEPYEVYNSDCWYFATETKPQMFFCQGYIRVCLDGRIDDNLVHCVVNHVP